MPSSTQSHARSHALLLLQKLLNLRDNASPLTLVLDTLEQSAKPVVREFLSRAKISKSKTIFVSFGTLRKPADVDVFVKAWGKPPEALRAEIASHYPSAAAGHAYKVLVVLEALNPLASAAGARLPLFLSSLVAPGVSLVGVYHEDLPLDPPSPASTTPHSFNEYAPPPLAVLAHLATAILRARSLAHAAARRRARDRSRPEPRWGLDEGREGVLVGLAGGDGAGAGLVLEMELRRRSGRSVAEVFVLAPRGGAAATAPATSQLYLLSEHPAFRGPEQDGDSGGEDLRAAEAEAGAGTMGTTFDLGLTEKQRRDREGVVLPYFDAQRDVGAGEGGRILYDMGREDDFDDEEDEI
ncbi:histone acetylation protein 2 [Durotheca rogersii]|uniref:histone acetylation protein 2 n=1 Tax=Durotheca rogersii TaxID=419775 RepID=UPI00221EC5E6|nr:histone acetylation protein 2 [Durotheca rogersii]KAI5865554.1 histone acetylation protein 2 [Durotheca rogersii]